MPTVKAESLIIKITKSNNGCVVNIGQSTNVRITAEQTDLDLAELVQSLRDSLNAQRRYSSDPVEIICDSQVEWDYFAKIYNVLYGAGLTNITFHTTE